MPNDNVFDINVGRRPVRRAFRVVSITPAKVIDFPTKTEVPVDLEVWLTAVQEYIEAKCGKIPEHYLAMRAPRFRIFSWDELYTDLTGTENNKTGPDDWKVEGAYYFALATEMLNRLRSNRP